MKLKEWFKIGAGAGNSGATDDLIKTIEERNKQIKEAAGDIEIKPNDDAAKKIEEYEKKKTAYKK